MSVSGIAKRLVADLVSTSTSDFITKMQLDASLLNDLVVQLKSVEAVSSDAETNLIENNSEVSKWLDEARSAILDAKDLWAQIGNYKHSPDQEIKYKWKKMSEIIKRLQYLATHGKVVVSKENVGMILDKKEGFFTSLPNVTPMVYGRLKDKEEIVKLLNSREGSDDKLRVIPIFGKAGVGKTTLASMVYNEEKTVDGSDIFDVKGWACASDIYEENHIIQSLLQSINRQESKVENNLELLQQELKERLQGKKYLLVLDDICDKIQWGALAKHFITGAPGSRIIVTTHSRVVAEFVSTSRNSYYELNELPEEESWSLFEDIAFPYGKSNDYPRLKKIGKRIVSKCNGLPLKVKMIGGLLHSKVVDEFQWKRVLENMDWKLTSSILRSLWLSYYHLPHPVQQCFTYLSIFPKDYSFTMEEIVMLWVAQGLIVIDKPSNSGNNGYEDVVVGQTYFNILCSNFFIQPGNNGFTMHELVHDLAVSVSRGLVVDLRNVNMMSGQLRWLCYRRNQDEYQLNTKSVQKLENLDTFLSFGDSEAASGLYFNPEVLDDLLLNFRLLRVLSLQSYVIPELPNSVRHMKLLRYLNLSRTSIEYLPEWICDLENLQILNLSNCQKLKRLPLNTHHLLELMHLNIEGTRLKEMPDEIGRLTSLRALPIFVLSKGKSKHMREFEKLVNLHGKLHISRLDYVVDVEDVVTAKFGSKEYLEELILDWDSTKYRDTNLDEQVLDAVKPHMNLKRLTIKRYAGKQLSDWIVGATNLVSLAISDCSKCEAVPSLGNLPFLKDLTIEGLDCLEDLDEKFYGHTDNPFRALEKFKISRMEVLKRWSFPHCDSGGFSSLKELRIESCELTQIPYCFPCLIRLDISDCVNLEELKMKKPGEFGKSLKFIDARGCPELKEIPKSFVNLAKVYIEVCYNLVEMPRLQDVHKLSLQYVGDTFKLKEAIQECKPQELRELAIWVSRNVADELLGAKTALLNPLASLNRLHLEIEDDAKINDDAVTLPPNVSDIFIRGGNLDIHRRILTHFSNLKSLTHLEFFECHALESFPDVELPSTLKSLRIAICDGLTTIPDQFLNGCSKSLENLDIFFCPNLACLPHSLSVLKSLQILSLDGCPLIQQFPSTGLHDLTNLWYLWISDCLTFKSLPDGFNTTTSILNLGIVKCPNFVFPKHGLPANLKHLTIIDCDTLKPISEMELTKLTSLTSLHLQGFRETFTLDWCLPESIEDLTIRDFPDLKSLSEVLPTFKNLKYFDMEGCPHVHKGKDASGSEEAMNVA